MTRTLLFLYGLPGVGKLTIAKAIHEQFGIPIYHNHLTSDLVYSVFERGEVGSLLKQKIRNMVIDEWAQKESTSLVTTLIYKKDDNESYFREMSEIAQRYGITVWYCHLFCSQDSLVSRVQSEERKKFDKITTWEDAEQKMKSCNMHEDLPFPNNFSLDTTLLSAQESAKKIVETIASPL